MSAGSSLAQDPAAFAPTGDVYAYFARRRTAAHGYAAPTRRQVAAAAVAATVKEE